MFSFEDFSNLNIGQLRVFSTRNMKAMTSRRCRDLPEVVAAKNREKEEKRRRCNRLMREVFNKVLELYPFSLNIFLIKDFIFPL